MLKNKIATDNLSDCTIGDIVHDDTSGVEFVVCASDLNGTKTVADVIEDRKIKSKLLKISDSLFISSDREQELLKKSRNIVLSGISSNIIIESYYINVTPKQAYTAYFFAINNNNGYSFATTISWEESTNIISTIPKEKRSLTIVWEDGREITFLNPHLDTDQGNFDQVMFPDGSIHDDGEFNQDANYIDKNGNTVTYSDLISGPTSGSNRYMYFKVAPSHYRLYGYN